MTEQQIEREMNVRKKSIKNQWKAFESQKESDIDYSEIPELDDEFFNVLQPSVPRKTCISLRIDTDVLQWLKSFDANGKGYQTRVNSLLRKMMLAHARGA